RGAGPGPRGGGIPGRRREALPVGAEDAAGRAVPDRARRRGGGRDAARDQAPRRHHSDLGETSRMSSATGPQRLLVALNGSPVRLSSVDLLLEAVCAGAVEAGGRAESVRCNDLILRSCQACGPEPTTGYCIFHDDMDRVYALLHDAHAVVVGSPI